MSTPPPLISTTSVPATLNSNLWFVLISNIAVPFLILKLFTSKSAPNCGELSETKSVDKVLHVAALPEPPLVNTCPDVP